MPRRPRPHPLDEPFRLDLSDILGPNERAALGRDILDDPAPTREAPKARLRDMLARRLPRIPERAKEILSARMSPEIEEIVREADRRSGGLRYLSPAWREAEERVRLLAKATTEEERRMAVSGPLPGRAGQQED